MKKICTTIIISFFTTLVCLQSLSAQDSLEFKPSGTVIAKGFLEYGAGLGNAKHESGFDITRAFLGYNYKFTPTLQAQLVLDGASYQSPVPGTDAHTVNVYVRNAFVNWKEQGFNFNIGLIGLLEYNTQELYWGHRYVLKSYQDLNNMGPSVDLGASIEYAFNPIISADFTYTNGEGVRKIQKDNSARYAAAVSIKPIEGLIFRAYADVYNESEKLRASLPEGVTEANYKNKYITALFAGYQNKKISAGVEYNHLYNNGFIENKNYHGYSVYTSYKFGAKYGVYGRYDLTESSQPNNFASGWNDLDGQLMIIGFEFQPAKQLKISPNLRNLNAANRKSEQYFYLNIDFSL